MDMEDVQYEALRKNWKAIVKDLDPNDVLDELYSKEVITKTEYEEVKNFLVIIGMMSAFLGYVLFFCFREHLKTNVTTC